MMSDVALRIMLLFLPGITEFFIIHTFSHHKKISNRDAVTYDSFVEISLEKVMVFRIDSEMNVIEIPFGSNVYDKRKEIP